MSLVYLQRNGRYKSKRTGRAVYQRKKGIPFPRTRSQFTGAIQTLSNRCRNSRFRKKHRNHFEKVKQLKEREDCEGDPRLRPYQRVDLDFLKRLKHCAIFWEMRLGKTPLTIRLIEENEYRAGIFVVPATLLYTWEAEIKSGVVGNV